MTIENKFKEVTVKSSRKFLCKMKRISKRIGKGIRKQGASTSLFQDIEFFPVNFTALSSAHRQT